MEREGDVLQNLDRDEEAIFAYKKFTDLNPVSADVYKLIASLCYKLNRYGEALMTIEKVIEIDPNDKSAHEAKRHILLLLSDPGIFG